MVTWDFLPNVMNTFVTLDCIGKPWLRVNIWPYMWNLQRKVFQIPNTWPKQMYRGINGEFLVFREWNWGFFPRIGSCLVNGQCVMLNPALQKIRWMFGIPIWTETQGHSVENREIPDKFRKGFIRKENQGSQNAMTATYDVKMTWFDRKTES